MLHQNHKLSLYFSTLYGCSVPAKENLNSCELHSITQLPLFAMLLLVSWSPMSLIFVSTEVQRSLSPPKCLWPISPGLPPELTHHAIDHKSNHGARYLCSFTS